MTIHRVVVPWNGLTGLPGVSVFFTDSGSTLTSDLGTFFNAIKGLFPNGLTWQIPTSGDILDEVNGELTGEWSGGAGATINGTGGASLVYVAGTGAYVKWGTATVTNGRRIRGRTFLTGIGTANYDASGTISGSAITTLQGAASALVTAGNLKIWHRPQGGGGGGEAVVTSATVPDQVTSLATRRR